MISSHGIIQFCEIGFHFPLQSKLFIDEINSLLSFLCPFYLRFLELLYCQVMLLLLLINTILGQPFSPHPLIQIQFRVNNSNNSNNVHFSSVRFICSPYFVVPADNDKTRTANEFRLKMNIIAMLSHTITSLISILCCTYIVFTITYGSSIKFLTQRHVYHRAKEKHF